VAECYSREGGERERRRLPPKNLRSRHRRNRHRLHLDVEARLIGVDLHEHVANAQGRALVMGDDELHLLRGDDTFSTSAIIAVGPATSSSDSATRSGPR
jgi:hypothetical protein